MAKITTKSTSGTSFFDNTISATVNELIELLGEPSDDSNTGQDKVNFEWECETNSGKVFTIYDWKEYRMIDTDEIIEWHIGAQNGTIAQVAQNEMEQLLNS